MFDIRRRRKRVFLFISLCGLLLLLCELSECASICMYVILNSWNFDGIYANHVANSRKFLSLFHTQCSHLWRWIMELRLWNLSHSYQILRDHQFCFIICTLIILINSQLSSSFYTSQNPLIESTNTMWKQCDENLMTKTNIQLPVDFL